MKDINIKYSLDEHIKFEMNPDERLELVRFVLLESMSTAEFDIAFKSILKDLIETEYEFDKREDVIKALDVLNNTKLI